MNPVRKRLIEKKAPLIGYSLIRYDPLFVDIAARTGIDVIWIEMEHAGITIREAEDLVRLISGNGMLSMIRLPNVGREMVLKAAESGAAILMAPMTNTPEDVSQLVRHARYRPAGERGYFGSSRALNYGMGAPMGELLQIANEQLMLWAQIETRQALDSIDQLCCVAGIDGLFMGPGDLSAEFGIPGNMEDARVVAAVGSGPGFCHAHKRICGTVCKPERVSYWAQREMDVLFVASNAGLYTRSAMALRHIIDEQLAELPRGKG